MWVQIEPLLSNDTAEIGHYISYQKLLLQSFKIDLNTWDQKMKQSKQSSEEYKIVWRIQLQWILP